MTKLLIGSFTNYCRLSPTIHGSLISQCKYAFRLNSTFLTPTVTAYGSRACLSCLRQRCISNIRLYSSANQPGVNVNVWKLRRRKFGIFVGCIGVLFLVGAYVKSAIYHEIVEETKKSRIKGTLCEEWSLVDHTGKLRSSKDFAGAWSMVYCGFTHCPDVCPDELEKMIQAISLIEDDKDGEQITPIFITLDPNRDTVPAIAKYVQEFSPKLIGFTGTTEQIASAARSYHVYFSEGAKDDEGDYIVDHSIIVYLINPDGEFVDYYGLRPTAPEIAASVISHIHKYKKTKALLSANVKQ